MHREFSYELRGKRILKVGPRLPKLLSNIKWLTFLEHGVFTPPRRAGIWPGCLKTRQNIHNVSPGGCCAEACMKKRDFRPTSHYISDKIQDRAIVTMKRQ